MTTISSNTNTVSSDLLATMNGTSASSTTSTDASQDKFLTLLVAQMKNQDPLSPMDNAEVTSQMAQLSTVTGINQLNSSVTSLMGNLQSNQTLQASSLIDHAVLASGNTTSLTSGAAVFGVDLGSAADDVTVSIKDSTGKVVKTMDLGASDAGTNPIKWDGSTDSGGTAADGSYTFTVSAVAGSAPVTATSLSYAMVNSVSTGASGVKLNLGNGTSIAMTDVRQIL